MVAEALLPTVSATKDFQKPRILRNGALVSGDHHMGYNGVWATVGSPDILEGLPFRWEEPSRSMRRSPRSGTDAS